MQFHTGQEHQIIVVSLYLTLYTCVMYVFARKFKGREHLFCTEPHFILDGKKWHRASLCDLLEGINLHSLYDDFLLY